MPEFAPSIVESLTACLQDLAKLLHRTPVFRTRLSSRSLLSGVFRARRALLAPRKHLLVDRLIWR
jgi:hypothetical protein